MASGNSATIYDVAQAAGISISTVSRYLNSPQKVNAETSRRIRQAMDNLAWIPQGNTGSKASRSIGRIGILTPFFPAPSFVQRMQGMTPIFRKSNCEMVIYTVDSPEQLAEYLHSIPLSRRLQGLIIMSMHIDEHSALRLNNAGIQVVMVEYVHPLFSCVGTDNRLGGALAAQTFIQKGYKSCGFIGEQTDLPYSLHPSDLRLEGYRQELERLGYPLQDAYALTGEGTVQDAQRMAAQLLALPKPPRAIFAMSDLQAIGVQRAARAKGVKVPQELAILGFDDIEVSDFLELSTISQSLSESGRLAAELLMECIEDPGRPRTCVNLDAHLVERSTT